MNRVSSCCSAALVIGVELVVGLCCLRGFGFFSWSEWPAWFDRESGAGSRGAAVITLLERHSQFGDVILGIGLNTYYLKLD